MKNDLELQCIDFLKEIYFPHGMYCAKCKKITRHYQSRTRPRTFQCNCGNQLSITAGTIFHKALRLTIWFQTLLLLEKYGALYSGHKIRKKVGTTYKTAWRMKKLLLPLLTDPQWQPFLEKLREGNRERNWKQYEQEYRKTHRTNGKMGAYKQWTQYFKDGKWPRQKREGSQKLPRLDKKG